jgi:hypothetical protein
VAVSLSRYDPSKSYKNQKSIDCGHKVINDSVARSLKSELAAIHPPSLPGAVPVTKLSMLGVSLTHARKGYGRQLLRHAIRVTVENARTIGSYGLYLDADDDVYDFYIKLAFVPLKARPTPNHTPMFLPIETARQAMPAGTT